jgi:ribonuclease HI
MDDTATVIELERRLLDPAVRRDRDALEALLHPEFCEFGASGRVYDRDGVVAALAATGGATTRASDFRATRLGPDAILLTYRTDAPSLRTSIWVRGGGRGWRVLHHQGTPAAR